MWFVRIMDRPITAHEVLESAEAALLEAVPLAAIMVRVTARLLPITRHLPAVLTVQQDQEYREAVLLEVPQVIRHPLDLELPQEPAREATQTALEEAM